MPPPRVGLAAYGPVEPDPFDADDPFGWRVTRTEETAELAPGLARLAGHLLEALQHLAAGRPAHGIPRHHLTGNPFWPEPLARSAGRLAHERCVALLALSLSRTQDDKGRVRWTLFGVSEQGPARAFWQSAYRAPGVERPEPEASAWLRSLLAALAGGSASHYADLRRAGLRILPMGADPRFPDWREEPLPGWARPLVLRDDEPLAGVRFVLTFRPFDRLPAAVQNAYLAGTLALLPFPGSLVFFGVPQYHRLAAELPFAAQIPLLHLIERHEAPSGLRVPQSGWLHEPRPGRPAHDAAHGPLRNEFKRTHRWARVLREQDELACAEHADALARVLFSTHPDDVRLYGKPMARNAQLWTTDYRRLLDGPAATREELAAAVAALEQGGAFGYRFLYPALRVGHHEIYWQRPLAALPDAGSGQPTLLDDAPLGCLAAYDLRRRELARPLELWPRLLADPAPAPAAPRPAAAPAAGPAPAALSFAYTARRSFELSYWRTIASLAEGRYRTKNNADCVEDGVTPRHLDRHRRDLGALGDHLLARYRTLVAGRRRPRGVLVGELPFTWSTEFDYPWMGGWLGNQRGAERERNLIVVIPGRDRSQAVIMADHYDTAYMEDRYEKQQGGDGARLAAAGADDNHSATAALLCGAPIFLELSRAGKLACDVWLVHLTGEEFPADCLGARSLCQSLVEGDLALHAVGGARHDLSRTRVRGVFVLDMIAHNREHERDRDVFQIAPGSAPRAHALAELASIANQTWNEGCERWNRRAARRRLGRGRRRVRGSRPPALARHLALRGELRPIHHPRSALYNTDGQIFSDAGVPVVLFMENYDIERSGYHDTHDTLANIDLDYGAALAAIAIEAVARAAAQEGR